jgi:hypothetical protein
MPDELLPWGYTWKALHVLARRAARLARPRFVPREKRAEISLDGIVLELAVREDYPSGRDLIQAGIATLNIADAEAEERMRSPRGTR